MMHMCLVTDIEILREELNRVVMDNKGRDSEKIIVISQRLDTLIHEFYKRDKKLISADVISR